jgi:hypothetical protein
VAGEARTFNTEGTEVHRGNPSGWGVREAWPTVGYNEKFDEGHSHEIHLWKISAAGSAGAGLVWAAVIVTLVAEPLATVSRARA